MRFDPSIVTVKQLSIVSQIVSSPVVLSFFEFTPLLIDTSSNLLKVSLVRFEIVST